MIHTNNFQEEAAHALIDDLNFVLMNACSKEHSDQCETTELAGTIKRFYSDNINPALNGLIQHRESHTKISPEFVKEQIGYFQKLGVPHIWWLTQKDQQENNAQLLEEAGYLSSGTYLGYAQKMENIDHEKLNHFPLNANVKIYEVKTQDEFSEFCRVLGQIFNFETSTVKRYEKILSDYGPGKTYRHIYAVVDDKVVGIMSALLRNGWCGVWNGGVLKEARKAGVGRSLCFQIYQIACQEQVQGVSGILMKDAQAQGLSRKFGAEKVSEIYPYLFGVSSEDFEPK